jgi:hypothetical protein
LLDLGLCRMNEGGLEIANPIYREVLPRVLTFAPLALPKISPTWLTETGELDSSQLLESFLIFWRQHGEPLLKSNRWDSDRAERRSPVPQRAN